ncbi:hypothetical protein IFM89_023400 [Coptis chinensis]|uniref:Uncharacterized protein n=1 Tax=Coptis chinensis TaxID=261450 RepID=A0A835IY10_9MAGN|nr:hypothetical protein IFM89_023400 [Coptis chinensis]
MKKTTAYPSPSSPITFVLVLVIAIKSTSSEMSSVDVGVILNLDTWVGKMSQSCISMSLSDYYSTHNYTRKLVLHTRNSHSDIVGAASAGKCLRLVGALVPPLVVTGDRIFDDPDNECMMWSLWTHSIETPKSVVPKSKVYVYSLQYRKNTRQQDEQDLMQNYPNSIIALLTS